MIIRSILFSSAALAALTVSALAADLPAEKGPPVYVAPPPAFSWTGVYIGGQIGYEWGRMGNSYYGPLGDLLAARYHNDQGVTGGGHVGYNYQINQFVIGLEGDLNGSSYEGTGSPTPILTIHDNTDFDGSIRGRVGVAFDRVLVYGTGGVAFGSIRNSVLNSFSGGFDSMTTGRVGWTVGGGLEYAIDNNWSVRAEYRYTDLGRYDFALINSTLGLVTDHVHETDNRVQAGFSYKFDLAPPPPPPVAAKY